jgi:predicted pyridoxine 5'-phosphate oxidase superfamily flavin-nucleotide-binding protein
LDTDEEEYGMGKIYDSITDDLARWLGAQTLFFVATATTDPDTHVNVSPRGLGTFRVLEPNRVAWLDLTGSGVETIAHLGADGRITLMFCAFDDPPQIIRLHGHGRVHELGSASYEKRRHRFPNCSASGRSLTWRCAGSRARAGTAFRAWSFWDPASNS